jgi:hypothetical protein
MPTPVCYTDGVKSETRFRIAIGCFTLAALCVIAYVWDLTGSWTPQELVVRPYWFVTHWQWLTAAAAFYLLGYCFLPKEDV